MATFHHYAYSDGELATEEIAEQLWRFCSTALGLAPEAVGGTVTTTVEIPESIDELLSPGWLTAALSACFPGVQVERVTRGPVVERVSTNARFKIEGDLPDGLPPALCAKGYFGPVGRGSRNAGVPEACFYRDLAHATGVRTLNSVWADVDLSTEHGVVITEDAVEAGAVFCDALDPCTVDRTAETLEQFALLHAYVWEDARFGRIIVAHSSIGLDPAGPRHRGDQRQLRRPQRRRCARRHAANAQGLIDAYGHLSSRAPGPGWAVAHGDAHVGNTLLDRDGRPGLLDWQVTQYGPWGIDVGYHIAVRARARRAGRQRA